MLRMERFERALECAVAACLEESAPAHLSDAVRYAVFPGGARMRPKICLAVAAACGARDHAMTDAAAASIELLHCASLVHDDLPCFDNADTRRGKPSVHKAYGERLALLAGDALIVLSFQTLMRTIALDPARAATLFEIVTRSVGLPSGIVAGQAWESELNVPLRQYQRAKTGALFAAATMAGAASAAADPQPWRLFGLRLGEAYQVADDLLDVIADPVALGKQVGQDLALQRPSATRSLGVAGAEERLKQLIAAASSAIPACSGEAMLRQTMLAEAERFLLKGLSSEAA